VKDNIVLIGFMGSGKTTVGKLVSQILGHEFIDTDELIEQKCCMKIDVIFSFYGEDYFRDIEARVISDVSDYTRAIVSCGGGAMKQKSNINGLRKNGLIIWLKAGIGTVYERIQKDTVVRPLAIGKSIYELGEMMASREELYKAADVIIDTSNKSIYDTANEIINIYKHQKQL
jgi:shikimate kinase